MTASTRPRVIAAHAALALLIGIAGRGQAETGRHIYWVDANPAVDEIYRINEDDSTTPLGIAAIASDANDGLAFDRRSGMLYWMSANPDALYRTPVTGTDVFVHEPFGTPLLESANPEAIAVDRFRGDVFWLETGRDDASPPILGSVVRRATDGTGQITVVGDLLGPRGLVADLRTNALYWGQKELPVQAIWRTDPNGSTQIVSSAGVIWDVDYDPESDRVFWTSTQSSGRGIYSHAADGSGGPVLFARYDVGDTSPRGLFIDSEARRLYWTDRSPSAPAILVADLDATGPVVLTTPDHALPDGSLPGDIVVERLDRRPPPRVFAASGAATPSGVRLRWAAPPDTSLVATTVIRWRPGFIPPGNPFEGAPAVLFVDDATEVVHPTADDVVSYALFFEDEDGNLSVARPYRSTITITRGEPGGGTATVYWTGLAPSDAESNFLGATRIGRGYTDVLAQDLSSAQRIAWEPLTRQIFVTQRGEDEVLTVDPSTGERRLLYDWCGAKGVAVDPFRQRVYWAARGGGTQCDAGNPSDPMFRGVFYGHIDGQDAGHSPIAIVDSTATQPNDVALDLWRNRIFWCSAHADGGQITSIDLATLDDAVPTTKTLIVPEEVEAIDIDPIAGTLYWTERDAANQGTIHRIDITGDWTSHSSDACFLTQAETEGVAYDPVGDRLFFADRDMQRVNVQTCGDDAQTTVFATDGEQPWDVAIRQDDDVPPADPFDVTARSGGNGVAITWSLPADAVGSVVRWREGSAPPTSFADGEELIFFTTTESTINHADLITDQDYSYRISAIDAAGNVSPGVTVTVTVIAEDAVGFELSESDLYLAVGMTAEVDAILLLDGGGTADVTALALWSSSDPGVVSVEPGRLEGVSAGEATITVDYFGYSESVRVRTVDVADATVTSGPGGVVMRLPNPDVGTASVIAASIVRRLGGEDGYGDPLEMTLDGPDWTVDASASIRGFEYVATLTIDDGGELQVGTPAAPRRASVTTGAGMPPNRDLRHHMIGLPAIGIEDDDVIAALEAVFGGPSSDTTWFLHRRITTAYERLDGSTPFDVEPGAGFWLATRTSHPWSVLGSTSWPAEPGFFEVPLLPSNWTMVGNPAAYDVLVDPDAMMIRDGASDPVAFSDAGTLVGQDVYQRVGDAYVMSDDLPASSGCWVLNLVARPLTLMIPAGEVVGTGAARSVGRAPEPTGAVWALRVLVSARERTAEPEHAATRTIVLGRDAKARDDWDPLDRAAAPPAPGEEMDLWIGRPDSPPALTLPRRYRQSVAGLSSDVVAWTVTLTASRPTTLAFALDGGGAGRHAVTLREDGTGIEWDLGTLRSLDVDPGEHRFELVARADAASRPTSPGVWLLSRPNPVSASTRLHYRVPGDGSAVVDVFAVDGRRVWSSGTRPVERGEHAVVWDLSTPSGRAAPAGVYFVRLEFVSGDARRIVAREKLTVASP